LCLENILGLEGFLECLKNTLEKFLSFATKKSITKCPK
jgi:hypothetical protein